MTEIVTFEAQRRDLSGTGPARATRRAGRIPAIVYGAGKEPVMISLDPKTVKMQLQRAGFFTHLVDIKLDGVAERTLPRDVQLHPVTDEPLHLDFVRVSSETRTHVNVAVVFENHGNAPGLKRGGVLNVVRHEVEVICRADRIPAALHVDLTGYDIGDSIHISAVKLPDGVTPSITDRDFTVATIAPPTVKQAEEEGRRGRRHLISRA